MNPAHPPHAGIQWRHTQNRKKVGRMVSNWAYMVMAALAWNLKSWFAMMMHLKSDRRKYAAMEFKRFIREMILLPCQVIRPRPADHAAHHRLAAHHRPAVQHLAHDRTDRLRLTPPLPTASQARHPARPRAPVSPVAKITRDQPRDSVFKDSVHPLASLQTSPVEAATSTLCQLAQPKLAARTLLACFGPSSSASRPCRFLQSSGPDCTGVGVAASSPRPRRGRRRRTGFTSHMVRDRL